MATKVYCPHCKQLCEIEWSLARRAVMCPHCNRTFGVRSFSESVFQAIKGGAFLMGIIGIIVVLTVFSGWPLRDKLVAAIAFPLLGGFLGLVFGGLRALGCGWPVAAIVWGIITAVMHLPGGIEAILGGAVAGTVFGALIMGALPPPSGYRLPEARQFLGHTNSVIATFSPDGRWVLTGSADRTARLWEAETGREVRRFEGHTDIINAVAFSPDGRFVLTGSGTPEALVEDEEELAEIARDYTARLWDVQSGRELRRFEGHAGPVFSVAFSPNGQYILTGSGDNTARLWAVRTGQEVRRFEGHTEPVTSVAVSPNGRFILTGSRDTTARLWDVQTAREVRRLIHPGPVICVAFSPDGRLVLSGCLDNIARVWDPGTARELCQFKGHTGWISAAAFSPDGRLIVTGSADATARVWDMTTGRELGRFGHVYWVFSVTFSPDGRYVLTGGRDCTARMWDVAEMIKDRPHWVEKIVKRFTLEKTAN